jgi:hypothetical protein
MMKSIFIFRLLVDKYFAWLARPKICRSGKSNLQSDMLKSARNERLWPDTALRPPVWTDYNNLFQIWK